MEEGGGHWKEFAVLYREVSVGLTEKFTSIRRLVGGQGMRHGYLEGENSREEGACMEY